MARVITIGTHKGGTGKTVTAWVLSCILSKRGQRVLALDLDHQCNLTSNFGVAGEYNIGDVMLDRAEIKDAILETKDGCDIIPGSRNIAEIDEALATKTGREYRLKDKLEEVADNYDFIIIDINPGLSQLIANALTTSDELVIPAMMATRSLDGIETFYRTYRQVKKYTNRDLEIAGILITMFDDRTQLAKVLKEELEDIASQIGCRVFETAIRRTVKVDEAQHEQTDLCEYAPNCTAAIDYVNWVEEYIPQ